MPVSSQMCPSPSSTPEGNGQWLPSSTDQGNRLYLSLHSGGQNQKHPAEHHLHGLQDLSIPLFVQKKQLHGNETGWRSLCGAEKGTDCRSSNSNRDG